MRGVSFKDESRELVRALSSKVTTAVGAKIETEILADIAVNKQIQNRQTFSLPQGESSPDIRTGVCGRIADRPLSFFPPEISVKSGEYFKDPKTAQTKKQKLKEGWAHSLDPFFNWINSFFSGEKKAVKDKVTLGAPKRAERAGSRRTSAERAGRMRRR